MSSTKRRFIALDALRGFAALLVVFYHVAPWYPTWLMVDFFFVLSGFVLSHSYLYSKRRVSTLAFINHRLARLYPLHIFGLLFFLAAYLYTKGIMPHYEDGTLYTFLLQLTLTQNVGLHTTGQPWNGPSWSISVEFWISLLFFLLVSKTTRSGALLLTALLCLFIIYHNSGGTLFVLTENYYGFINSGLLRGGCSFLLGVLCYRIYLMLLSKPIASNRIALSLLEISALVLATLVVLARTFSDGNLDMLAPFAFMLVVIAFSFDGGLISRWFSYFRYLGTISYSIYLNHIPVGLLVVYYGTEHQLGYVWMFWTVFTTVIVLSHFTYRYIENPARKKIRAWGEAFA